MEAKVLEHDGQWYLVLPPGEAVPAAIPTQLVVFQGTTYRVLPANLAAVLATPKKPLPMRAAPTPKKEAQVKVKKADNWLQTAVKYLVYFWLVLCASNCSVDKGSHLFGETLRALWHALLYCVEVLAHVIKTA